MKPTPLEIHSPHGEETLHVPPERMNQRLSELLRQANLPLNTRCGGRGRCDGCMVELLSGDMVHATTGQRVSSNGTPTLLRGCEYRLERHAKAGKKPITVRIPPRSMLVYQPQIVTDFRVNVPYAHDPLLQILTVPHLAPALAGMTADAATTLVQHLCRAVAKRLDEPNPVRITPQAEKQAQSLPDADPLYITAARREGYWLIRDVAGQAPPAPIGAAIDIGTTTVVVLLADLTNGKVLSRAAQFNQQMRLGDDVVTRITLCTNDPAMLRQLQDAVAAKTIAPLLAEAAQTAKVPLERIACLSIAGNTTMLHLLAGVDPSSMGVAPFTPTFLEHRVLTPAPVFHDKPGNCSPAADLHLLPSAAAYIGSDLTAGVIASGLLYDDGPSLLVDVGTNGEVILKIGERFLGCATAAGPAFEGAGLSCGIRAGDGAVSHITLSRDPFTIKIESIAKTLPANHAAADPHPARKPSPPIGLCGSAYIDFLAEAHRVGLILPTGRFDRPLPPPLAAAQELLIPWNGTDFAFIVARGLGKQPIVISQADIAQLLQAKAAIAAGILTLLEKAHLTPRDVKRLYLAGGFGMHIEPRHAINCGLLAGFLPSQIQTVGNTALAGAYLALLDSGILEEMSKIGRSLEVVELNLEPNFEMCFIDQLSLPTHLVV